MYEEHAGWLEFQSSVEANVRIFFKDAAEFRRSEESFFATWFEPIAGSNLLNARFFCKLDSPATRAVRRITKPSSQIVNHHADSTMTTL